MKAIPKKGFLLKQVAEEKDGKTVYRDVIAERGKAIEVTEAEYKKFGASYFDTEATEAINDKAKKK